MSGGPQLARSGFEKLVVGDMENGYGEVQRGLLRTLGARSIRASMRSVRWRGANCGSKPYCFIGNETYWKMLHAVTKGTWNKEDTNPWTKEQARKLKRPVGMLPKNLPRTLVGLAH